MQQNTDSLSFRDVAKLLERISIQKQEPPISVSPHKEHKEPPQLSVSTPTKDPRNGGKGVTLECTPLREEPEKLSCLIKETTSTNPSTGTGTGAGENWLPLYQKFRNSVVQILAESVNVNPYAPYLNLQPFQSRGSALFISEDGYLLTNFHVVMKGMECFVRRESEGERVIPCEIVNLVPSKDVALLKVPDEEIAKFKEPIYPLKFGDSDKLQIPDSVAAFGFPLGFSAIKLTLGAASGFHREPDILGDSNNISSLLQISTPIAAGSSGGPVLSINGECLGITSSGIRNEQNFNFAIPSKVIFSMLRPLFSKNIYKDRLVPVPTLGVSWQATNTGMLQAQNVASHYRGGLRVTKRTYPYLPRATPDVDLQEGDIIVELRTINPYSPEKKYTEIQTYREPIKAETKESNWVGKALISREDACELLTVKDVVQSDKEAQYISGGTLGMEWNVTPGKAYPAYRVTFQNGDETIKIEEKQQSNEEWKLSPLYKNRKMLFTDFLDILPPGLPLLFVLYRNGRKICLEKRFVATLPQYKGLKQLYPPYQNYVSEYEVLGGLTLMNLALNHYTVCLPHIVRRLEGKERFEPAVVTTHMFNLSSVARMNAIEPLGILQSLKLYGPALSREQQQRGGGEIQYTALFESKPLHTVQQLREQLMELVNYGIQYYNSVVEPNLELFSNFIKENVLRADVQSLMDAKHSIAEIDKLLSLKYQPTKPSIQDAATIKSDGVGPSRKEQSLVHKYRPLVTDLRNWKQLLILSLHFEHGNAIYLGFPQVFVEDYIVQHKLQVPISPFAQHLYQKLDKELISKFDRLFKVPGMKTVERGGEGEGEELQPQIVIVNLPH